MAPLNPELLAILVCPVPECHGSLAQRAERLECTKCGLEYRVEQSWPVLIPEEAVRPAVPAAPVDHDSAAQEP
jgi:uncharacterized protein YbaR (Trm112 family)